MPFKRSPEPIGYIPPQLGLEDALQYAKNTHYKQQSVMYNEQFESLAYE